MNEFTNDHKDGCLPGLGPFVDSVATELSNKLSLRGTDYTPRTKHLNADGTAKYTNRLLLENSPYLLQHAHNPVNWFPWGDEAFDIAKQLNRPVFLSIGYSTCHWCHVMEEESFENELIAEYLNRHYICIKVDREERPDVDSLYMTAVQAIAGRGGWPMSMWLSADRKPFFGGTYFPPFDGERDQQFGFLTVIQNIFEVFHSEPLKVSTACHEIFDVLHKNLTETKKTAIPERNTNESVIANYTARFDQNFGGVIPAPKFPSSMSIKLLLREHHRTQDKTLLTMATRTLDNMAAGGIHDHIGGGFHRYSTDAQWLVPHFEKMLYDNALLCTTYLEAYQATQNEQYQHIALNILRYVAREMTNDLGAFYSATDADSLTPEGEMNEGYFFTWTIEEINELVNNENYLEYYNISTQGNFEGRNILHTEPCAKLTPEFKAINEKLLVQRSKRNQPLLDDKILTSWNALMISAFAKASFICNDKTLLDRAITAAKFILDHLYVDKKLYRTYKDGVTKHLAFIDDYAYLIQSMLDLFEASFDIGWLEMAIKLDQQVEQQFEDQQHGGFFISGTEQESLFIREKPVQDGAQPSGNSIMAMNMLRLNSYTSNDQYRQRAKKVFEVFGDLIYKAPSATTEMLCALDYYYDNSKEIIVVYPGNDRQSAQPLLDMLRTTFLPNRAIMCIAEGEQYDSIPMLTDKVTIDNQPTVYVCEQGLCQLPVTRAEDMASKLNNAR